MICISTRYILQHLLFFLCCLSQKLKLQATANKWISKPHILLCSRLHFCQVLSQRNTFLFPSLTKKIKICTIIEGRFFCLPNWATKKKLLPENYPFQTQTYGYNLGLICPFGYSFSFRNCYFSYFYICRIVLVIWWWLMITNFFICLLD